MGDRSVAEVLSEFVCGLHWDAIPAEVQQRVKTHIADTVGVMLAGSTCPPARMVLAGVTGVTGTSHSYGTRATRDAGRAQGNGGGRLSGWATVVGLKCTAPAVGAALVNGTSAHGLELDDGCSGVHPGAPVLASALAAVELAGAGGREFLCGVLAGYETAIRVNLSIFPHHRRQGYHPTATCGTFGAAAAAGRILGLDADQMASALGLAGTQAAGLREGVGAGAAMMKRLHAGKAAEGGLLAALLAREGFLAPATVLDGEFGFLKLHSPGYDAGAITRDLGTAYAFTGCYLKPYPACRQIHGPIDSLLSLRREYGLTPDAVKRVRVRIYREGAYPILRTQDPESFYDAQFSIPYVLAAALVDGEVTLAQFDHNKLRDPSIRALCKRIEVEYDEMMDEQYRTARLRAHRVEVDLWDGRRVAEGVRYPKGSAENPLSPEEVRAKFIGLAAPLTGKQAASGLHEFILGLPAARTLDHLYRVIGGGS